MMAKIYLFPYVLPLELGKGFLNLKDYFSHHGVTSTSN